MYRKNTTSWIKHLDFIFLDIICLEIALFLAVVIRHGFDNEYINHTSLYWNLTVTLAVLDFLFSIVLSTFKNVLKKNFYQEITATLTQMIAVESATLFYMFVMKNSGKYSRQVLILLPLFYFIFSLVCRQVWKYIIRRLSKYKNNRSMLILGCSHSIEKAIKDINNHNYGGIAINGLMLLDKDMEGQMIGEYPVVANKENILDYLCQNWVDEVFVAVRDEISFPEELIEQITEMGIAVHIELDYLKKLYGQEQFTQRIGDCIVLTSSINTATNLEIILKRTMDIVGGIIGCIITALIALILGPLIYLQSPGPIFFSQERVGRNGKTFRMYKFRSMYMDAEERKAELMAQNKMKDAYMFKLDFDPRIIGSKKLEDGTIKKGIGNYIREFSIDEFPQFFNVLKGDMSIIGTRPPLPSEVEIYKYYHKSRLAMKPGITGLWQISGRSDIIDFDEIVSLDRQYINEWSLGLDLKIMLKTILVVFGKKGAI